jgi:hypothetical protein
MLQQMNMPEMPQLVGPLPELVDVGQPVSEGDPRWWRMVWGTLATASFAASVYHGYKRNDSVGWAIGWGVLGALFPVITPTIAVAQGFAKPKRLRR